MTHLQESLNNGGLPSEYYALTEQRVGGAGADVLGFNLNFDFGARPSGNDRTRTIRHASGDRVVALIEFISPTNKASPVSLEAFLHKAVLALRHGYHLLVLDLHPSGVHNPQGIHGAIWSALGEPEYDAPEDAPLTLAAYAAGSVVSAYVEPTAVGRTLIEMPLFITRGRYVNVPLEETYMAAWRGVPQRWRQVIEGAA